MLAGALERCWGYAVNAPRSFQAADIRALVLPLLIDLSLGMLVGLVGTALRPIACPALHWPLALGWKGWRLLKPANDCGAT